MTWLPSALSVTIVIIMVLSSGAMAARVLTPSAVSSINRVADLIGTGLLRRQVQAQHSNPPAPSTVASVTPSTVPQVYGAEGTTVNGAAIGGIVGCAVFILVACVALCWCGRRWRTKSTSRV